MPLAFWRDIVEYPDKNDYHYHSYISAEPASGKQLPVPAICPRGRHDQEMR
jgi:hypothetical protein